MNNNLILGMALGFVGASSAQAALVLGELQATDINNVPTPINVVNNDLLQTNLGSVLGSAGAWIADGETITDPKGGTGANNVLWLDAGGLLQTDFYLDVSSNTQGYDIEDIRVFTAWDSNRAQAGYNVSYSVIGSADFTLLGTVGSPVDQGGTNNSSDWTFLTRTYDDEGGTIAGLTGVDAIRFDWDFSDGLDPTRGPVFKEIDVIGAVTVPEPSSFLLGVAGMGLMCLRCRRS
ncbi:PEP-CTERM sorting domain-containing protein [Verrucomicrobiaceae bacterium 5K15]|uniref:PEP-CTERM sorting domain-containing protein n=1 Tax=Oceaniferula flava TaxID=2800421 RepID=A0AAE2SCC6_9BACT|nr:PEP-CTERM sorting domain-containing protein [Oceaniferula flavus]MBK1855601.1 PEP-CTERM sorting domain-containing protein [Oceaniferula flavus]MBM1136907.1 PEP-CTERM sorting domain-containing protein [Oceaniferula flavus]